MKCQLDNINVSKPPTFTADSVLSLSKYKFPKIIDSRDLCLPTNNQGNTPHCVGFSVAGYLEVEFWKRYHYPKQFPAHEIYRSAKDIENNSCDGTTIELGFSGAKKLNLFEGDIKTFEPWIDNVKFQLHKYGIFCGAFEITDEWYDISWFTGKIKVYRNPEILGGHAVLVCGYNDDGIYIQNSWGYNSWGKYGFAMLPWELVQKQLIYGVVVDNINVNNIS